MEIWVALWLKNLKSLTVSIDLKRKRRNAIGSLSSVAQDVRDALEHSLQ